MSYRLLTYIAATLTLTVGMAGCADGESSSLDDSPAEASPTEVADTALIGDAGACVRVEAPMLDVPPANGAEPVMRVPEPAGWHGEVEHYEKSDAIRFALRATDLSSNWRNVAVVALEPVPDLDVEALFDREKDRMVQFFNEEERASMTTTRKSICGLAAQQISRRSAEKGLITAVDVVTKTGGKAYVVGVLVSTKDGDERYRRDAETILNGFQVLPPAG